MSENKDKILVALDGSKRSFKTIEYLCGLKPFLNKKIVLYNVISAVPECYYDLKNMDFSGKTISEVRAWELSHRKKIQNFMEKAKQMLMTWGFKSEAIIISIEKRYSGTARDIIAKAQKGYYALLIRRRGTIASILPVAMGSIATKLIEKAASIPILLAGTKKANKSFFIAVDGSEGSKRAVEFLAEAIGGSSDYTIILCSVLRDFEVGNGENGKESSKDCIGASFKEIEGIIENKIEYLTSMGIKREKIITKIIQGAKSRAAEIIEAAEEEDCGTVVFGRKGRTDAANFDIGRVPWKVINSAKKTTVWVIP